MTNHEDDLLAAIDELERDEVEDLVNWQLSRFSQRTGYDFNVAEPRCPWGPHEWHGLPHGSCPASHLTREEYAEAKKAMRVSGTARNPHYSFDEDAASLSIEYRRWLPGDTDLPPGNPAHECTPGSQRSLRLGVLPTNGGSPYSLADIDSLRGGFVRPYLPPVIRGPVIQDRSGLIGPDGTILDQLLPQIPRVLTPRPVVRFWGMGPDGFTQVISGELIINDWTYRSDADGTTYEITANLHDPSEYMYTPQALMDSMDPAAEELPTPTEPLEPDRISMEVQNSTVVEDSVLEGFQAVGTLDPDALVFDTEREYIETWGGQRVRTVAVNHSVTMALDAESVNAPLLQRLIFGGGEENDP